MKNLCILGLILILPWGVFAGALADLASPVPVPVPKYVEMAGTVILGQSGAPVFLSNGKQYSLLLPPGDPGFASLKTRMALIVKGMVTVVSSPEGTKLRSLRPLELIIRGHSYKYSLDPS